MPTSFPPVVFVLNKAFVWPLLADFALWQATISNRNRPWFEFETSL